MKLQIDILKQISAQATQVNNYKQNSAQFDPREIIHKSIMSFWKDCLLYKTDKPV